MTTPSDNDIIKALVQRLNDTQQVLTQAMDVAHGVEGYTLLAMLQTCFAANRVLLNALEVPHV